MSPFARVIRWFLFVALVSLLPFILHALFESRDKGSSSIESVFGRGDLFIAAIAIGMDCASELIAARAKREVAALISSFACLAIVILATGLYVYNAAVPALTDAMTKSPIVTNLEQTVIPTLSTTIESTRELPTDHATGRRLVDIQRETAVQSLAIYFSVVFSGIFCRLLSEAHYALLSQQIAAGQGPQEPI